MQILGFLLDNLFFVLVGAMLLRAWMNQLRLRMTQQPGLFVMALSDWIVKPLRRALPRRWQQSQFDWASLLAADLLALAYALILHLLLLWQQPALDPAVWLWSVPWLALKFLLRTALQGLIGMTLIHALLSWIQPLAPVQGLLSRLLDPLLQPLRQRLPRIGGVDLSALVLLLLLQVLLFALA